MCLLTWPSSLPTRSAASHSITLRSTAHPGDCDWNQWAVAPELTEINEERIHRRSRRLRGKLTCQWGVTHSFPTNIIVKTSQRFLKCTVVLTLVVVLKILGCLKLSTGYAKVCNCELRHDWKLKLSLCTPRRHRRESFLTSALDGEWMVSFMLQPLCSRGKILQYPLNMRRVDGPHCRSALEKR
jgi:hypothetical protein